VTLLLAIAFGGIAALPFGWLARRERVTARLRSIAPVPRRARSRRARSLSSAPALRSVARVLASPRRRRQERRRDDALRRELPVVIDLAGVAVAAGCTPFLAIEHATRFGPPRAGRLLRDVTVAVALGQSLDAALRDLGASVPILRPLADALRTSVALGSPAAPALARLAGEVRADTRRRAEARARTVPVRLCFPLVACVLPAFALLTVVPVVLGGLRT
jgi:Flp pilus assembly protein TadB